jgi:hypothetical protein
VCHLPDRLILAKISPAPTLGRTVRTVQARLEAVSPKGMVEMSNLEIPVLDFVDNQVRLQLFALAYNLGNLCVVWRCSSR